MKKLLVALLPIVTFVGCQPAPAYAGEVKLTSKVCTLFLSNSIIGTDLKMDEAKIVDGVLYFRHIIATDFRLSCN